MYIHGTRKGRRKVDAVQIEYQMHMHECSWIVWFLFRNDVHIPKLINHIACWMLLYCFQIDVHVANIFEAIKGICY